MAYISQKERHTVGEGSAKRPFLIYPLGRGESRGVVTISSLNTHPLLPHYIIIIDNQYTN